MQEADKDAPKNIKDTAQDETERVKQLATDCEEPTESCADTRSDAFIFLWCASIILCLKRELCDAGGRK